MSALQSFIKASRRITPFAMQYYPQSRSLALSRSFHVTHPNRFDWEAQTQSFYSSNPEALQQHTIKHFSDNAQYFDMAYRRRGEMLDGFLISDVEFLEKALKRKLTILDVGAGNALHASILAKLGHQVTALEPSDLLDKGKERYADNKNLKFVKASLPDFNLGSSFDLVYSMAVFHYIPPAMHVQSMECLLSHLNPQHGVLSITWPYPPSRSLEFQNELPTLVMKKVLEEAQKKFSSNQKITANSTEETLNLYQKKEFGYDRLTTIHKLTVYSNEREKKQSVPSSIVGVNSRSSHLCSTNGKAIN